MIESLFGGSTEFGSQKQASFGRSLRDTHIHTHTHKISRMERYRLGRRELCTASLNSS